jgi:selenide,water dikinase
LNHTAGELALKFKVHACTDITGFGVLGHALEIARSSSVRIELEFGALPSYPNSMDMYRRGETTGSNRPNKKLVEDFLHISARLSEQQHQWLFDPQTSGGLLLSVPPVHAQTLLKELKEAGVSSASIVGNGQSSKHPEIRLV